MRFHPRKQLPCLIALAALVMSIPVPAADREPSDLLVEPATLPELIARTGKDTVLLDCRSRNEHETSRVAGARWVDLAQLKNLAPEKNNLTQPGAWMTWRSEHGVRPDGRVIVYDDGNMTDAARMWFLLQLQGIRHVSVLDGGFPELKPLLDAGRIPLASGPIAQPASPLPPQTAAVPESGSCPVNLADKQATLTNLDRKDTVILDVRTEDEFRGADQVKNPRHGHLPGAVSLPHTRLLTAGKAPRGEAPQATQPSNAKAKGRLKPVPELRTLFEQAGIGPDQRVIVQCQSGGRAALVALALVHAGYHNVSNYYGSFGEWSADASLPVVGPRPASATAVAPPAPR